MRPIARKYQGQADYHRIRAFLREIFLRNGRREWSWQAYRFDYWRWHGTLNMGDGSVEEDVYLWETTDGRLAGVLNPEARGHAFLQVDPALRCAELEEEMILAAEQHLVRPNRDGKPHLCVWAHDGDRLREDILHRRGYARGEALEHQRRRSLSQPIADVPIAEGYRVRALGHADELPARSHVSWKAFHPDEPDERYQGWYWYRNIQRAPLYRRQLDLVAVAPMGEFAAFCTVWYDDLTRAGAFEPVGTHPEHQRRGLGKAVMVEGLRRLAQLGAEMACVGSYSPGAHALYASVGFAEFDLNVPWVKMF